MGCGMKDVIIVLACGIHNGNLSDESKKRVEKGVELYKKHVSRKIIMSGSLTEKIGSKIVTEAELMKKYAIFLGVPSNRIILENESKDTLSSAYFVKKIIDKNKWNDVTIVTSKFHMKRTMYIFRKVLNISNISVNFISPENSKSGDFKSLKRERYFLDITKKIMEPSNITSIKRAVLLSSSFMLLSSLKFIKTKL